MTNGTNESRCHRVSSSITVTDTTSRPSSRMSALTFFRFFTETYSSTPLPFRFFFLAMPLPPSIRSSRTSIVGAFLILFDRLGLLGRLDLVLLCGLLAFGLDRAELPIIRLFASCHLLLDSFETLGNQARTASDVAEYALQVFRTLLEAPGQYQQVRRSPLMRKPAPSASKGPSRRRPSNR